MFRDEVLAMAHLRHPGIVSVYDLVRTTGDDLALVMELRPGEPLSRGGRRSFAVLRPILLGILDALAHAHARGVLHLDIKPDNVLVAGEAGHVRTSASSTSGSPRPGGAGRRWRRARRGDGHRSLHGARAAHAGGGRARPWTTSTRSAR